MLTDVCRRRQSAEEKELRRLQSSLPCKTLPLKPEDDGDDSRQMSPSSVSLSPPQQSSTALQALQRLQPWSNGVTGSSRPFTVV